jgi:hypothetical protein
MLLSPPGNVERAFEDIDPCLTQGFLLANHGPGRATNNGTGMAHLLSLRGATACNICGNETVEKVPMMNYRQFSGVSLPFPT